MRSAPKLLVIATTLLVASSAFAQEGGAQLGAPVQTPTPAAPKVTKPASTASPPPTAPAAAVAPPKDGVESRVRLRPVDRATVRVVSVGGADATAFKSSRTGLERVAAIPRADHGTGVVVSPDGLILTARHVTWATDVLAVLMPGSDHPLPARIVYIDPDHDIAFIQVEGATPSYLRLPDRPKPLELSQQVSASGYPLDIRQRYPAAVSGQVSRENNDGSLQVAMSVNPGNSGGPVIDDDGDLIGIVTRRGEPEEGVAGIALLEPLRFILAAYHVALKVRSDNPPAFHRSDDVMAQIAADFVRTSDKQPIYEQTTIPTLEAAAAGASTPEATMIVAAHAWNMHIALLEARRCQEVSDLTGPDRARAARLLQTALQLSRKAIREAPYLRYMYPIARSIVNSGGHSFVRQSR